MVCTKICSGVDNCTTTIKTIFEYLSIIYLYSVFSDEDLPLAVS